MRWFWLSSTDERTFDVRVGSSVGTAFGIIASASIEIACGRIRLLSRARDEHVVS